MDKIKYREWILYVDRETTKETYNNVKESIHNDCQCNYCENYKSYLNHLFPQEIKTLFFNLGINCNKPCEICHYCREEDGHHLYSGWFHFRGNFEGENCRVEINNKTWYYKLVSTSPDFKIGFHYANSLAYFDKKYQKELVQIEYEVRIPWVIDKLLESE